MDNSFYENCREVIRKLRKMRVRPIKGISQHFIVSCNSIKLFYDPLSKFKGQDFLEIGTGMGYITSLVSQIAKRVVTVEVDRRLSFLKRYMPANVELLFANGLDFMASTRTPVLVSNPPYSITSELLVRMVKNNSIKYAVLGLQKEVAERLVSNPGESNYGRIAVLVQYFFSIRILGNIPPKDYYPRPKVESSVLLFRRIRDWSQKYNELEKLTSCLFSQKNKRAYKVIATCSKKLGLNIKESLGNRRVRELTPEEIVSIIEV